ncbi:MAG: hypothetical protein DMG32_21050 [Acidobacteria bacterium]|nr:MAG: hypothetical protein DMG32_21050 [Acidobacteriota bacterium]
MERTVTNSVRVFGIRVLSLFVVTFCGITLHAQDANKPTQDHSKESFVVQRILNTVQFENDGTFAIDSKLVVRLQSASGIQAWGLIQVPYASNEGDATIAEVKVTKPNGAVVSTPDEDIQDTPAPITVQAPLYSDLKIKQLAVKGLEIGDTVSYQQSVHVRKPLIPGQFWFARDFFKNGVVLDERLEIRVPKDRYVKVQSPKLAPKITDESGYRVYLWQTANLEHSPEENNSKPEPGKGPLPDVQITSFRGWDEIARWYQQLEASRITPTPEIKARAEEITRDAKSDDEKIRLLYNYVATKFRYIGVDFGIGRYQPHAAAEVLANGYGDCKDKHTLLAVLILPLPPLSFSRLMETSVTIRSWMRKSMPAFAEMSNMRSALHFGPFRRLSGIRSRRRFRSRGVSAALSVKFRSVLRKRRTRPSLSTTPTIARTIPIGPMSFDPHCHP